MFLNRAPGESGPLNKEVNIKIEQMGLILFSITLVITVLLIKLFLITKKFSISGLRWNIKTKIVLQAQRIDPNFIGIITKSGSPATTDVSCLHPLTKTRF